MGIQSVERAFAVLAVLANAANSPNQVQLTTIASQAGLPKSTVSRILATLTELGVVVRGVTNGSYQLGPGARLFSGQDPHELNLVKTANPILVQTVEQLGEDLSLAVIDGYHMRYLDQVSSLRAVRIREYVGERTPLHTTAAGLVALSDLASEQLDQILSLPLPAWGRGTPIDPTELRSTIDEVRATDVAWTFEAWADGVNGAAVPIRDQDGSLIAVLNAFGPSYRFPGDHDRFEVADLLRSAATTIIEKVRA